MISANPNLVHTEKGVTQRKKKKKNEGAFR